MYCALTDVDRRHGTLDSWLHLAERPVADFLANRRNTVDADSAPLQITTAIIVL